MDSVTHIVLGAAIGDRLLGKKIGRKAAWIGALAKTFPDFDLLISGLNDPRKYILYHRSYTHSFFIELLTAFPMAWLFYMLFKKKIAYKEWFLLWIVCLWGHSLVDMCTNYGTRLFLPFSKTLVSLNNISIVDLVLTIPILIAVILALCFRNNSSARIKTMQGILAYTLLYFSYTFINKMIVNKHIQQSLASQPAPVKEFMTNPTILNNFLWYGVANTDSSLLIGEYSLFQKNDSIKWYSFPIHKDLLLNNPGEDARMLEWFSQGYYHCQQNGDTLDVFIPKFGRGNLDETDAKKTFLFYYQLYRKNGKWELNAHQPNEKEMDMKEGFKQLCRHIMAK